MKIKKNWWVAIKMMLNLMIKENLNNKSILFSKIKNQRKNQRKKANKKRKIKK